MKKARKYTKELRFSVGEELHSKISALAERRNEHIAEVCRRIVEDAVDRNAAEEGLDIVTLTVRKAMTESLKPFENRLASMMSKSTIASATTMYHMQHVLVGMNKDPRPIHEEARKKAVSYLRTDLSKLNE